MGEGLSPKPGTGTILRGSGNTKSWGRIGRQGTDSGARLPRVESQLCFEKLYHLGQVNASVFCEKFVQELGEWSDL